MYALGITLTYGIVGGVFSALGGTVGQLFTYPWFLFALAALMFGLGLSMFGLYEIGIPKPIAKQIKGRTGAVGALVMGLLMGFAAAPCAGALVAGVAIKVSEIGSIPYGVMVFSAIGLGMGLPFMVLASLSQGAKALPKSGSWLTTVKAVLGLVVLYIGVDFLFKGLGLRIGEPETLFAWAIVFLVMAAYLLFFERGGDTRFAWGLKGAVVLLLGFLVGQAMTERSAMWPTECSGLSSPRSPLKRPSGRVSRSSSMALQIGAPSVRNWSGPSSTHQPGSGPLAPSSR
jgi:thiol:disulfide interchange protein DsbD